VFKGQCADRKYSMCTDIHMHERRREVNLVNTFSCKVGMDDLSSTSFWLAVQTSAHFGML